MLHMTVERMSGIHVALCNLLMVTYAMFSARLYNRSYRRHSLLKCLSPPIPPPLSFKCSLSVFFPSRSLSHPPPLSPQPTFFCFLCNVPMGAWLRDIIILPLFFVSLFLSTSVCVLLCASVDLFEHVVSETHFVNLDIKHCPMRNH